VRDILPDVERWRSEGAPIALATVLSTWGSAPRVPGAKMAVTADGRVAGSVSGGCVEGAVVEIAGRVLRTGEAEQAHFGVADETAWSVGLACGGAIDVRVEPLDAASWDAVRDALADGRAAATLVALSPAGRERRVVIEGDESVRGSAEPAVMDAARAGFADGRSRAADACRPPRPAAPSSSWT
jgi:xanthine dehydrogenase accessory factor